MKKFIIITTNDLYLEDLNYNKISVFKTVDDFLTNYSQQEKDSYLCIIPSQKECVLNLVDIDEILKLNANFIISSHLENISNREYVNRDVYITKAQFAFSCSCDFEKVKSIFNNNNDVLYKKKEVLWIIKN